MFHETFRTKDGVGFSVTNNDETHGYVRLRMDDGESEAATTLLSLTEAEAIGERLSYMLTKAAHA